MKQILFSFLILGVFFTQGYAESNEKTDTTPFVVIGFIIFVLWGYFDQKKSEKSENKNHTESNSPKVFSIKVENGQIIEYINGIKERYYGGGIISASTDGEIVAALTRHGQIEEYIDGKRKRTYGVNVVDVRVIKGTVIVSTKTGTTEEYINGKRTKIY